MSDRLESHLIALGLNQPGFGQAALVTVLEVFVDDLLMLIDEVAPRLPGADQGRFHGRLGEYRTRLAQESDPSTIERLSIDCLTECRHYFERAEALHIEQHQEIASVVELLRDTLASLVGAEAGFDSDLHLSAERFLELAEIDELRTLKARLHEETETLKRAIAERQQSRQQTYEALSERVTTLEAQLVRTRAAAALDGLTRLANRETFDVALQKWAEQPASSFVLALVDIDNFKSVNDSHGHCAGDQVLISLARTLARSVRSTDLVARLGGDEFALLAPDVTIRQFEARMCRTVAKIGEAQFDAGEEGQSRPFRITVSCGVAELTAGDTTASLLQRADEALYGAKHRGKNRVVVKSKPFLRDLLAR